VEYASVFVSHWGPIEDQSLPDLTSVALDDLRRLDESPLAHALRRLRREIENNGTVIAAGFESAIEPEDL
jgi:FXSXX-COOH protein